MPGTLPLRAQKAAPEQAVSHHCVGAAGWDGARPALRRYRSRASSRGLTGLWGGGWTLCCWVWAEALSVPTASRYKSEASWDGNDPSPEAVLEPSSGRPSKGHVYSLRLVPFLGNQRSSDTFQGKASEHRLLLGSGQRRAASGGHLFPDRTILSSMTSYKWLEMAGEAPAWWLLPSWKETTGFDVEGTPVP